MIHAVFLDRDGTINVEKNFIHKPEQFTFERGSIEAIAILNKAGFKVIVITNQSGIARGYYTEDDVKRLHEWVNQQLAVYNAHIDAFYYCPHHPEFGNSEYKKNCNCRKPGTGLIDQAAREHDIDITTSFLIGDRETDINAGISAGVQPILVLTGYGLKSLEVLKKQDVKQASNLYEAVKKYIVTP